MVTRTCAYCGKEFVVYSSVKDWIYKREVKDKATNRFKRKVYCSNSCMNKDSKNYKDYRKSI